VIKIHILHCGDVGVDPAVPDRSVSTNPMAYTGLLRSAKRRIWLPVKAFYIEHPKGKILIDTGWDSTVRNHPIRTLTVPMWFASKPNLPAGQAIDEQLDAMGVKPAQLDYVILTHMDIDHDSGLRLVKDAKRILISPEEEKAIHSTQVRYVRRPWKDISIQTIPFQLDQKAPHGQSWDVFGDKTVIVFSMPGHSQGSVVIKIQEGGNFVLIVGDTGYNCNSWEQLKLPGPVYDKNKMRTSLRWVQTERLKSDCVAVLAAHDPEEKQNLIELRRKLYDNVRSN